MAEGVGGGASPAERTCRSMSMVVVMVEGVEAGSFPFTDSWHALTFRRSIFVCRLLGK
ncbi:MAG: hypothetical protein WC698_06075 [Candidatus Peribacteraceae bacterium]